MADYHYDLKVIMCRERGDTAAVGALAYSEPTREVWNLTYEAAGAANEAAAKVLFLAEYAAKLPSAPQHIKLIGTNLLTALGTSATVANHATAASGAWSERVGKDVFRYEIGVTEDEDAAAAATARTAHNLA